MSYPVAVVIMPINLATPSMWLKCLENINHTNYLGLPGKVYRLGGLISRNVLIDIKVESSCLRNLQVCSPTWPKMSSPLPSFLADIAYLFICLFV